MWIGDEKLPKHKIQEKEQCGVNLLNLLVWFYVKCPQLTTRGS